jgi:uncharacterized protein DUF1592/uncharacterized protein DUF1588/uncharacterized protein DUF1595/uncharacterized protein DUF1585/uncharacterized protein DUF1587
MEPHLLGGDDTMRRIAAFLGLGLAACHSGIIGDPSKLASAPGSPGSTAPMNAPGNTGTMPGTTPPTETPPPDPCASGINPGRAPMRRLSNTEYRYTVTDLLGSANAAVIAQATRGFTSETESLGFRNSADFLEISPVAAQQYMDAAEQLSAAVGRSLLPCDPTAVDPAACAHDFIAKFGRKAFRRPLAASEIARYEALYTTAASRYDFDTGLQWIIFAMLQSPLFLDRIEITAPSTGQTYAPVGPYEIASRLSYLFWLSMPDDALFDAASKNELSTPAQIEAQARRMLADPKARRVLAFFDEWLDTDQLPSIQRDPMRFPEMTPELAASLREETRTFADHVIFESDGDLQALFTAPFTYVDALLARHYGLPVPSVAGFSRVDLDPAQRAGIFSQGGPLTVHDRPTRTSIVRRGLKIRTDFLCQNIGAPPPNVNPNLPEATMGVTQRQRLEQHRTNGTCAACHNLMDPIGVVFENFDALGRLRTQDENGLPIDTTSTIEYTADANGPVTGAVQLAQRLAASEQVRKCFTTQLFRFAYGRGETPDDACSQKQIDDRFKDASYRLKEALVSLTQTNAFLYRPIEAP